ncbi:hypothetical protein MOK15_15365 [Sphingobium sp. BYY-5]|uniref:hypothetical protein n=1 Tax=Sphingobium sp. BYY-5 TaxID=2926400 RepID=UPI001FA7CEDA|nr:hypothetical protein [Sphingobium sp. BYY-5]MCI4591464.1 hypothetical protein [Sphingobium sp. BYY-5]
MSLRTSTVRLFRYAVLLAMAPIAMLGLSGTPNEYRAMGIDAVDCDGPISVLIFAVPALIVYGAASAIFLRRWRRRRFLVAAILCALLSVGLLWNIGGALGEQWRNAAEPICESGQ